MENETKKLTCGDCIKFNYFSVSNCDVVGYGTKSDNNPCDRFESKKGKQQQLPMEFIASVV